MSNDHTQTDQTQKNLTKTQGELNTAQVSEHSQLTSMQVQDVEHIQPQRPEFVDDELDATLKSQADTIAQAVLDNPSDATVTVQVYSIGSEFMNDNSQSISLMDAKISDVMREIKSGSGVNLTLTQIKTQLDLINPAVVSQTETSLPSKTLFGLVTRVVSRLPKGEEILNLINERKDTVASTIDGLKRHLRMEKDKALLNATELAQISNRLFETQKDLQQAIYVGQMIWQKLGNAKGQITDPVKAQALSNLVNDLAVQVVDVQTVDTLNVQSRMSAESLISNARKIQQGVTRVSNVLLPAVATNLMVKAAAAQQASLVDAMNNITRAAESTIADTQKQTRQAVTSMEQMQSEGLIDAKVLQSVANDAVAMIEELEQIRTQTEKNARETSNALSEVSSTMRKYADPMTNARHALERNV